MLKHKFYLRTNRANKAGESALYFLINTTPQSWIATGMFLHAESWSQDKQMLLPCNNFNAIAAEISSMKAKADRYFLHLQHEERIFSVESFTQAVINGALDDYYNPSIAALISEYIELTKLSFGRYRHYLVLIEQLHQFSPNARLKEIDYHFAKRFEKFLMEKNNQINTIGGKIKKLKAVIHYAMHRQLIKEDPLKAVKVSIKKSRRTALTIAELLQLQNILETSKTLSGGHLQTLRNFLFCCYTGLRYGDLRTLEHCNIAGDMIYLDMHKTGSFVSIPVTPFAAALLQRTHEKKCFEVFTNEASNRHLKDIAKLAALEKVLTFHVSRHTFATVSLQLGMELKTVSEILGHTSVKMTEQYLHLLDDMKKKEMSKWDRLTA